ncbi:PTS sugar transporter subunit IIA [Chitinimonas koreensis]|uniref:PTS sugar transporter subunit IIA n=1 Tax=Chitinimonas koreensis TaxID=356302 RepID=UPI000427B946|nr:PTS sugar transporter subunit IIA [Chitinimonas koreensis]QNM94721.1 PTS sugar transporter subunit IIA [Chitinimonas koreensis]
MDALARICPAEDILLQIELRDRPQLFEYAARHLQRRYGLSAGHIAQRLAERERLGSTSPGQGFAIPHARLPGLSVPLGLFIRPNHPIAFDAPDGEPAGEILILLVPEHAHRDHLRLLADAVRLLCDRTFRSALRAAATAEEIRLLLLDGPGRGAA